MRFNIVKKSDVSYGTALHYAIDWIYGRTALCGQTMRTTARDSEVSYKRRCGSCVKIMAKIVEKAHAEALPVQIELDHAEALETAKDRLDIADFDEEAVYAQAEPVLFRIQDTETGLVRHILGTSLATNAPYKTLVWVQREGEQGAQPWIADGLMSTWHDLVAIDRNGQRNRSDNAAAV